MGVEPYKALKQSGYQAALDRMSDLLAVQPRIFIEVLPGETFSGVTEDIRERVKGLEGLLFKELDKYKVPLGFKEKVRDYFYPRQFQGATLTEIAESLPGQHDKSNVSRAVRELTEKTGYDRLPPKPRGKTRPS